MAVPPESRRRPGTTTTARRRCCIIALPRPCNHRRPCSHLSSLQLLSLLHERGLFGSFGYEFMLAFKVIIMQF